MIRPNPRLVFEQEMVSRVRSGKNAIGITCGPTGSGKTWFTLRLCQDFFPSFDPETDIVFDIKSWIERFNEMNKKRKWGQILVFDEGHEFSARRSMSQNNVIFSEILAMIRFTSISSIFTLPDIRMVDINAIRLMHFYWYMNDIDRLRCEPWQKTRSGAKMYLIQHEKFPRKDGNTFPPLRFPVVEVLVKNKYGEYYRKTIKITDVWLRAPSKEILDIYNPKKEAYFAYRLDKAERSLNSQSAKEARKEKQEINLAVSRGELPISAIPPITQMPQANPALFAGNVDDRINNILRGGSE